MLTAAVTQPQPTADPLAPTGRLLRIAWIGPAHESGGVAGMGTQLLASTLALGHDVDLYTPEEPAGLSPRFARLPNLTVHHFPSGFRWDRWYSRRRFLAFLSSSLLRTRAYRRAAADLIRQNRERPYDCIFQVSQTELFNLGRHRRQLPPIVVYPCVHAAGELRWHRLESRYARQSEPAAMHYATRAILTVRSVLQRRDYRKPARVVGMSQHFNDLVAADYGVPPDKMSVLYHPIPAATGTPGPGSPPGSPVRLVYVARLSVRKGLQYVVDLSHRLDDLRGRVTLEVIGGATLWSNYTAHLKDLNPNVATYAGELAHDRLADKLAASDGLLLPSRYEPGGLVIGEALAHGTPVVVSDVIGSAEPVSPDCCRRFPDGDMDAFEREVRRLVADTLADRRPLRAAAAAEARRHFAPDKVGADLTRILRLASAHVPPSPVGTP